MAFSLSTGTTNYTLHGKNIVHMTQGSNSLHFFYDASNKPAIVDFNGTKYAYVHNLQGDIVAILDSNGSVVVQYKYDAWGQIVSKTGSLASTLGAVQPFRYRGYVYDEETEYYYLRSRYYAADTCRFINSDAVLVMTQHFCGNNFFVYCLNSPVNWHDPSGFDPGDYFASMDEAAIDFATYINARSIRENVEYASYIYTKTYQRSRAEKDEKLAAFISEEYGGGDVPDKITVYIYREPARGTIDSSSPPINWFWLHNVVARVHTHGAYTVGYYSDEFSSADKRIARRKKVTTYVATPKGALLRYTPGDGTVTVTTHIPFDPNHPQR